jgi:hypothetical protein
MHKNSAASSGKTRWICRAGSGDRSYCYSTTNPELGVRKQDGSAKPRTKAPIFTRTLGGVTTLLVTAAQNATPIHKEFVATMEAHANHVSGEIIAIPYRYKNPTSRWDDSRANAEYWAEEITPYLCNRRMKLNPNLMLMGDVKIQATASEPLARMDALSHGESALFGHPKLQLKTIPTPQGQYPKILTTTGCATLRNYSDTALGKIGEFHNTMGAAVVELRGKRFHLRQINAQKTSGEYIDLDTHYTPDGAFVAERAQALVLGDWHKDFTLPGVEKATFTDDASMIKVLRPKVIAWHDLDDNYSVNPHHHGNFLILNSKIENNRINARAELERACQYVIDHTPADTISLIVPSNHNDFLSRWILATDPRTLVGDNLDLWLDSVKAMRRGTKLTLRGTEYPDAFVYWAKRYFEDYPNVKVLERGDSFTVAGIELGLHFDKGPNGARGSLRNLRRIGVKVMGGHGHGPGISEGGFQVGTATGELEYGIGSPSGWLNTHGSIDALGKRALLNIIQGEWRL